jgi:cyclophilin family peptidyl-prolyl cis-trans isomerase
MSARTAGPRMDLSDLMEASFWEANKGRIIGSIAVITAGILVFQYVRNQREAKEQQAWESLLGTQLQPTADPALVRSLEGTTAAPWAAVAAASNAFHEKNYDTGEQLLQGVVGDRANAPLGVTDAATKLLADIQAERQFRNDHPEAAAPSDIPAERALTLVTEVGEIEIGLEIDRHPSLCGALLRLARDGSLARARFDGAEEGSELLLSLQPVEGAEAAPTVEWTLTPEELARLRRGDILSHVAGSISFVAEAGAEAGTAKATQLRIALTDRADLDDREVVFGRVIRGLDSLLEVAKRKANDEGELEAPLAIQSLREGSALAAFGAR